MNCLKHTFKYCTILAISSCLSHTIVNAQIAPKMVQESERSGEFGLRLMPTISSFQMKTSEGNTIEGKATVGFGMGALAGFNFNERVGLQGELLYFSISQTNKEADITRKVNLKYFNIPMLLSLNTGKSQMTNLNLVLGPQLGINAGSSVTTEGGDGVQTPQAEVSVKKADLGFAYGAGLDFGLNESRKLRLGIGFRGVYGLFDVSDGSRTTNNDSYLILDKSNVKTYSAYIGISILL